MPGLPITVLCRQRRGVALAHRRARARYLNAVVGTAGVFPRGTHTQTLGVHVDWRRNAQLAQQWFMRESAETSYEAPESVFRLREIVTPPLVASTERHGWLDQVQVSVTRE